MGRRFVAKPSPLPFSRRARDTKQIIDWKETRFFEGSPKVKRTRRETSTGFDVTIRIETYDILPGAETLFVTVMTDEVQVSEGGVWYRKYCWWMM
jgi:hypothetical protein